ncbi:MAG: cysteine-rich CWC family protein [Chitinophagaceae bacterium]|nr:cysteine-rich CWC family protein [Chitinophagaceae bacterium]
MHHEQQVCPRCGTAFECRVGDVTNCQCYGIQLSAEAEAYVQQQYPAQCLCRSCLLQLQQRYHLFVQQSHRYSQR